LTFNHIEKKENYKKSCNFQKKIFFQFINSNLFKVFKYILILYTHKKKKEKKERKKKERKKERRRRRRRRKEKNLDNKITFL